MPPTSTASTFASAMRLSSSFSRLAIEFAPSFLEPLDELEGVLVNAEPLERRHRLEILEHLEVDLGRCHRLFRLHVPQSSIGREGWPCWRRLNDLGPSHECSVGRPLPRGHEIAGDMAPLARGPRALRA